MVKTFRLVLIVFLLSTLFLPIVEADILKTEETDSNLHVQIDLRREFNVTSHEIDARLCENSRCKSLVVETYSFTEGNDVLDIFLLPEESGDYFLEIDVFYNGVREQYRENTTINRTYSLENRNQTSEITGRLVTGETNPLLVALFILGVMFVFYVKYRSYLWKIIPDNRIFTILIFLVSLLLVSTITHELFHITVLEAYSCPYSFEYEYFFRSASVEMGQCVVSDIQVVFFLLSGLVGNLVVFTLLTVSFLMSDKFKNMDYLAFSFGFLVSVSVYFFNTTGDIHSTLDVLNMSSPQVLLNMVGLLMLLLSFFMFNSLRNKIKEKK